MGNGVFYVSEDLIKRMEDAKEIVDGCTRGELIIDDKTVNKLTMHVYKVIDEFTGLVKRAEKVKGEDVCVLSRKWSKVRGALRDGDLKERYELLQSIVIEDFVTVRMNYCHWFIPAGPF